jgi:hypothetical protein
MVSRMSMELPKGRDGDFFRLCSAALVRNYSFCHYHHNQWVSKRG